MKDIRSGSKLNERFRADEQVERVHLEQRAATFLFREGELLTFMDSETFEQTAVDAELVGAPVAFLQDGMAVQIESYAEEAQAVVLPATVVMEVVEADDGVKGTHASSSDQPACVETGRRGSGPPFIEDWPPA